MDEKLRGEVVDYEHGCVVCRACGHGWVGVWPAIASPEALQCPKCGAQRSAPVCEGVLTVALAAERLADEACGTRAPAGVCGLDQADAAAQFDDDPISHPKHYTAHPSGVECIEIAEHFGFCLGSVVKYVWRAGLKGDALEDLRKARWFLDREIARREGK